ncbi:MAG TPA: D-glucuronyl C5-epimerase family protein [Baekduia sp.]|nr:D-glucuronyl C5-epimerase family protein [Baekduia sp.]
MLQTPVGSLLRALLGAGFARRTPVPLLLAALVAVLVAAPTGTASAASKHGPTVAAELQRLVADGTLDPALAARYRAADRQARTTLKRLHGFRHTQLKAVIANVDSAARGGLLIPSRLPALFLTLQRNRAWWAAAPIPAAGQRMTFSGSLIVWQFYPGQGLQIQWLGTFGKANALWQVKGRDPELRRLLDEALGLATQRAGGIAFEYLFRFDGGRPPWVSGLAHGTALSALSRAAVRLKDPRYFDAARSALGIFRTPPPAGVRVATPAGAHYLQYSYAPELHIANGFTQALNGLHDFAALAHDAEGQGLFAAGEAQLRSELPGFDTGAWSLYAKPGVESDLGYHRLLRDFLRGLCDRLTDDVQRAGTGVPVTSPAADVGGTPAAPGAAPLPDPALYCDTAERFTADLTTRPVLTVMPPATLRARASGSIQYTTNKVAIVTVTIAKGATIVVRRTARAGYGSHVIGFRPAQDGPHTVRVHAVDLAGNAADATAALDVAPARKPRR